MLFSSWLRNKLSIGARPSQPRSSTAPFRPGLEALEDRLVPTFAAPASYSVGDYVQAVATADMNNDGKLDIITANSAPIDGAAWGQFPSVKVLLAKSGRNTGFETARSTTMYLDPTSLVVGDLDNDGRQDVAAAGPDGIVTLLGAGNGSFRSQVGTDLFGANVVAVGHFNGDSKLDLVTTAGVLWGNGDGSFGSTVFGDPFVNGGGYRTPGRAMAIGDANKDGKPEFIVISGQDSTTGNTYVSVQWVNPDYYGTFGDPHVVVSYGNTAGTYEIQAVAVGDFKVDGKLDVAVSYFFNGPTGWNTGGPYVDTFVANDSGGYYPSANWQVLGAYSGSPQQLAAADFNGDGKQDLVTVGATATGYAASVLLSKGDGSFSAAPYISTPLYSSVFAVSDFNGDGYADLVVLHINWYGEDYVDVLKNDKQWGTGGKKK